MKSDDGQKPLESGSRSRKRAGAGVTIAAVARQAGVSAMTVSNVINNKASVQPSIREAVLRAVADLGYRPNPAARALASASLLRIGLMHRDEESALLSAMLTGSLQATADLGVQLVLRSFTSDNGLEEVERFARTGLDGLLLPPPLCERFVDSGRAETIGLPVVAMAPGSTMQSVSGVRIDDEAASHALTQHLIARGHRRIAFIQLPGSHVGTTRLAGHHRALEEAGLQPDPDLVWQGRPFFGDGLRLAEQHLGGPLHFTAVMAGNDDMAAAFINTALRRGMRLPHDLSITGFDDTPIASKIWPALTTVRQPLARIAARATELLVGMLRHPAEQLPATQTVEYELLERASVSAPPRRPSGSRQ